ncbi:hypothetical protein ACLB2K_004817 [Fragaria x ananassa]
MSETGYEISLISSHPVPCPARHQQLFWIRIRGIPPFYLEDERREETGKCIGGAIGTHVRSLRGRGSGLLGNACPMKVAGMIFEPVFSDLLNAEKKEEWLRSKFASEEEEGALDLEDGVRSRVKMEEDDQNSLPERDSEKAIEIDGSEISDEGKVGLSKNVGN